MNDSSMQEAFFPHPEGCLQRIENALPPNESDIHAIREIIETRFQGL